MARNAAREGAPRRAASFAIRAVLLVSSAHFFFDWYMNFPAPLMPLLTARLHLSLTQCGMAVAIASLTTSFSQPLWGWVVDRGLGPWALAPCVLWASLLMVPLCWAPSYATVVVLATLGGLGGGLGHPLGSVATAAVSGGQKGLGMAIYSTVGSLGYALTPLAVVPAAMFLRPAWGVPLLLIPGVVGTVLALSREVRGIQLDVMRPQAPAAAPWARAGREPAAAVSARRRPASGMRTLALLNVVVGLRAWVHYVLVVFIPLYFTRGGLSEVQSSWLLSAFLLVGCAGGLLGGAVSDRWGRRNVLVLTTLATAAVAVPAWFVAPGPAMGLLMASSFLLQAAFPATVVYAQELAPENAGVASGLMTGLAWGLGGLGTALTGVVADRIGLSLSLAATTLLLLVAAGMALVLPFQAGLPQAAGIGAAQEK